MSISPKKILSDYEAKPLYEQYVNEIFLKKEDKDCVLYAAKLYQKRPAFQSWRSISPIISHYIKRVWNAVKSIFGYSCYQLALKCVEKKMQEKLVIFDPIPLNSSEPKADAKRKTSCVDSINNFPKENPRLTKQTKEIYAAAIPKVAKYKLDFISHLYNFQVDLTKAPTKQELEYYHCWKESVLPNKINDKSAVLVSKLNEHSPCLKLVPTNQRKEIREAAIDELITFAMEDRLNNDELVFLFTKINNEFPALEVSRYFTRDLQAEGENHYHLPLPLHGRFEYLAPTQEGLPYFLNDVKSKLNKEQFNKLCKMVIPYMNPNDLNNSTIFDQTKEYSCASSHVRQDNGLQEEFYLEID